ncbi:MAG: hypothetical protein LUP94_03765 [Candidatus Methanomethylicus sp.]|nr:hypothetical protein [Candidatus Methanomethylicus sp.]
MEKQLKTLRRAEDVTAQIEKESKEQASEHLKKAEAQAKSLEADAEKKAKAAGEQLMETQLANAKKEAEEIRIKGAQDMAELEKRAKSRFDSSVDEVVATVKGRMKVAEQ